MRRSLLGIVMLWATDFLPLWKKVSGVQILLAIRLLSRRTAIGPLNLSRSSFQLCLKNTSMVYSYWARGWWVRGCLGRKEGEYGSGVTRADSRRQMLTNPVLLSFFSLFFKVFKVSRFPATTPLLSITHRNRPCDSSVCPTFPCWLLSLPVSCFASHKVKLTNRISHILSGVQQSLAERNQTFLNYSQNYQRQHDMKPWLNCDSKSIGFIIKLMLTL